MESIGGAMTGVALLLMLVGIVSVLAPIILAIQARSFVGFCVAGATALGAIGVVSSAKSDIQLILASVLWLGGLLCCAILAGATQVTDALASRRREAEARRHGQVRRAEAPVQPLKADDDPRSQPRW